MNNTLKIFIDTEFTSLTTEAQLLSLALVTETGEKFYAVFTDFDDEYINPFVRENVQPYLEIEDNDTISGDKEYITEILKKWLKQFGEKTTIQMWADVPHYDWVLFCELFGGSLHLPKNVDYMCLDLATLLVAKGYKADVERVSLLEEKEIPKNYHVHNALSDAEVGMILLKKLLTYGK